MEMLCKTKRDTAQVNSVDTEQWIEHCKRLWFTESSAEDREMEVINARGVGDLELDELADVIETMKNRKRQL